MIKISEKLVDLLFEEIGYGNIGIFCDEGAVIGDVEFVIVSKDGIHYLAHISEFEQEGVLVRLKNESK